MLASYKNALIKNVVILFAFFCAFESIDFFFRNQVYTIQYNTTVFYTAPSLQVPRTRERNAWVAFITIVHFRASAFGRCR